MVDRDFTDGTWVFSRNEILEVVGVSKFASSRHAIAVLYNIASLQKKFLELTPSNASLLVKVK
jgi:hypothetical protein